MPITIEPSRTLSVVINRSQSIIKTEEINLKALLINDGSLQQDQKSIDQTDIGALTEVAISFVQTTCPPSKNETSSKMPILTYSIASLLATATVMRTVTVMETATVPWKSNSVTSQLVTSMTSSSRFASVLSSHDIISREINTKSTNSSNNATTNERSYIFAMVFGIFGGAVVFAIAVMIFKSIYTKSKNRVKKIKKTKIGKV